MCVCFCAESKWHGGYAAAHPVADTQSGGRASEDQSRCEKGQQFAPVFHTPWSHRVSSRKASRREPGSATDTTICASTLQKCELRKRMGIAGMWDSVMTKVNTPFQPDVPNFDVCKDSQTRAHFKTLKHAFIRDKLYLWVPAPSAGRGLLLVNCKYSLSRNHKKMFFFTFFTVS